DANLREMGAGDLGVGRRVKRMAGALYGRIAAYEAGIDGGEAELRQALRRNLFGTVAPSDGQVAAMARYVLAGHALLAGRPAAELRPGAFDFPNPEPAGSGGERWPGGGASVLSRGSCGRDLDHDQDPCSAGRILAADRSRPDRTAGDRAGDRRQRRRARAAGRTLRPARARYADRDP